MRVVIITSIRQGLASSALRHFCDRSQIDVCGVVFARRASENRWKLARRKLAKTSRIGVLGALNGIRLRSWYADRDADDIFALCGALGVPIWEVPAVNCDQTRRLLRHLAADLGLALGTSYLAESVFSIPTRGMINVHTEILPRFRGAQSIIWPIHEGLCETGFTIHQVSRQLDGGTILFQQKRPIQFRPALKRTVIDNLRAVRSEIPAALIHVCENYGQLRAEPSGESQGKSYTTPTIGQFAKMAQNNRRLYRETRAGKRASSHLGVDAITPGVSRSGRPAET